MQWHNIRLDLRRSAALLTGFAAVGAGFHTVLGGSDWWWSGVLVSAVILGTATATLAMLNRGQNHPHLGSDRFARISAPIAAFAALVITLTARFASDTAIGGFIPTIGSFHRFQGLIRHGAASVARQSVPASPDTGIVFLFTLGIGLLVMFACILTFSLRVPAVVGLPMAAVFLIPSLVSNGSTDLSAFAVAAASYLVLLTVGRARQPAPAAWIGLAAIVLGLVLPSALPAAAAKLTIGGIGPGLATGVNPMISLGNDLRRDNGMPVLTYTTVSGDDYSLRLVTLRNFSGKDWSPDAPASNPANSPGRLPAPPGLAPGVATTNEISYLRVQNLVSPWLPVPYPTSRVTGLSGHWSWQPKDLSIASTDSVTRGQNYTVVSVRVRPTPQQLQSAGTAVPPGFDPYLELPAGVPPIIAATAKQVTVAASSNYEKAIALQEFFRSNDFVYSEQAPVRDGYDGTGMAVIAKFLHARSGYCIHFAAAMAVMARTLGIPSRIAVGFQPGSLQGETDTGGAVYQVTTRDLHAWPELYFSGVGWVPFEPTPGRGVLPDYTNQLLPGVPASVTAPGAAPGSSSTAPSAGTLPRLAGDPSGVTWLSSSNLDGWVMAVSILLGLLLFLLPAGTRAWRRQRCLAILRNGKGSARLAWREVVETAADVGAGVSATLTPRATVQRLSRAPGMTESARAALDRLGVALERELYGPATGTPTGPFAVELATDAERVIACLRAGQQRGDRARSFLLPPSLVSHVAQGKFGH